MFYSDSIDSILLLIIAILLSSIIIYCFKKFKKLNKLQIINKDEYKRIKFLSWLFLVVELPSMVVYGFLRYSYDFALIGFIERILLTPFQLISSIIPVYIASLLFYRIFINPYNSVSLENSSISLEESVKKIFDSNKFYSILSEVLPTGKDDKKYGFDYIPFMLHDLEGKRIRHQKSSKKFLMTTVSLSIIFVATTIIFGYMLMNESSIGIYKELDNLKSDVNTTRKNLSIFENDPFKQTFFYEVTNGYLQKLEEYNNFDLPKSFLPYTGKIKNAFSKFEKDANIDSLQSELSEIKDSLSLIVDEKTAPYLDILKNIIPLISNFKIFRDHALPETEVNNKDIKETLQKIGDKLREPINAQNELLKRLILSLVVITFFMAILRYFRSLYQSHYQQMLKAEEQSFLVRKFYVTFKSSENNPDERKIVLASFLDDNVREIDAINRDGGKEKDTKIEKDLVKDFFNAILKKL